MCKGFLPIMLKHWLEIANLTTFCAVADFGH